MEILMLLLKFFGGLVLLFASGWLIAYLFNLDSNIKE
jgi:hypothetical protein